MTVFNLCIFSRLNKDYNHFFIQYLTFYSVFTIQNFALGHRMTRHLVSPDRNLRLTPFHIVTTNINELSLTASIFLSPAITHHRPSSPTYDHRHLPSSLPPCLRSKPSPSPVLRLSNLIVSIHRKDVPLHDASA